ncbi:lipase family protein|uniref:Lipase (Class 3) n=1 Tax=Dendrosporobacter quercicolus TaxID=146817 RepID=A0A1G9U6M5_9FIRM|nr:lipase family protein [Dendrosporobacter quercicolus]NSL48738.1 lipase family protein [Dendrosporobacter quercicolus DSM 1736]SDM55617.1 Lipase (class 3) [Dendrosporobacter quercicolus]
MKRLLALSFSLLLVVMPVRGLAGPQEEYETAYKLYIAAGASAAAYHDRAGLLAARYLARDGWRIRHYIQPDGQSGARFVLAEKDLSDKRQLAVLAIVGTETAGDIKMNLQVEKVPFPGVTAGEADSAPAVIPPDSPKVHKGFHRFTQSGLAAILRDSGNLEDSAFLPDLLQIIKTHQLLITGHSLGGAAATLAAAGLISAGAAPEQLEVITFGAPAVGNAAFAQKYEPQLRLTRVVMRGDPVTGVLQTLVGGYKQFGREIIWSDPPGDNPHELLGYVDAAIRNYYDKRQAAGIAPLPPKTAASDTQRSAYIAPLQNNLPAAFQNDFRYMQEALWDEYRQILPESAFASGAADWKQEAAKLGYRWLIVPEVRAIRLQQAKNTYYVTLQQTIYDARTGNAVDTAIFSTATSQLTPLEAFIHSFRGLSVHTAEWL